AEELDPPVREPWELAGVVEIRDDLIATLEGRGDVQLSGHRLGGPRDAPDLRQRLRWTQKRLRGHAGVVRALAPDEPVLDDRHLESACRKASRADLSRGSRADHDNVEAAFAHRLSHRWGCISERGSVPWPAAMSYRSPTSR